MHKKGGCTVVGDVSCMHAASLTRLKSFSGMKSTTALDSYLGTAEKEQKKAIE